MKQLFCRVFWIVLVPVWLVFVVVPFLSSFSQTDYVLVRDLNLQGYWLYGFWFMTFEQANTYYLVMVGSAFLMSILWKVEWIFSSQLIAEKRQAEQSLAIE